MCRRCDLGSIDRYCDVCRRIKMFEFFAKEDGLIDIVYKIILRHPEIWEEIYAEYDISP